MQADPLIYTAGGLSSGIDLALHIVAENFGTIQAQRTADYMEYQGTGWKSNQGISALTTPVTHHNWTGALSSGSAFVLHQITTGVSSEFMVDIAAQKVSGMTVKLNSDGDALRIAIPINLQALAERPVLTARKFPACLSRMGNQCH